MVQLTAQGSQQDGVALQAECLKTDPAYREYFLRFFSLRSKDGSIRGVENVTQEVLIKLQQLQNAWEVRGVEAIDPTP